MRIRRISVGLVAVAALLSACGGGDGGAKSGEESGGRSATDAGIKDGGTLGKGIQALSPDVHVDAEILRANQQAQSDLLQPS